MRVLCLSPIGDRLRGAFEACGDEVAWDFQPPTLDLVAATDPDLIVNYGSHYIYGRDVLARYNAINLHISLLPWNRGAHPNFWSWYDDTPKGVTIHVINNGIDRGDILAQCAVELDATETLSATQNALLDAMDILFNRSWSSIRDGRAKVRKQPPGGSYHSRAERDALDDLLSDGNETKVSDIMKLGADSRR